MIQNVCCPSPNEALMNSIKKLLLQQTIGHVEVHKSVNFRLFKEKLGEDIFKKMMVLVPLESKFG